jgi:hypothetical protein
MLRLGPLPLGPLRVETGHSGCSHLPEMTKQPLRGSALDTLFHLEDVERRLAALPAISVLTITFDGKADGVVPSNDGSPSASKFSGSHSHPVVEDVGHPARGVTQGVRGRSVGTCICETLITEPPLARKRGRHGIFTGKIVVATLLLPMLRRCGLHRIGRMANASRGICRGARPRQPDQG